MTTSVQEETWRERMQREAEANPISQEAILSLGLDWEDTKAAWEWIQKLERVVDQVLELRRWFGYDPELVVLDKALRAVGKDPLIG